MTKRPDTGRASVSPCPMCSAHRSEVSDQPRADGGKAVSPPEATGSLLRNGAIQMDSSPLTVTVANAVTMTGLSDATLYRLIERGELATIKIGRRRLIPVESIKRLVGAI